MNLDILEDYKDYIGMLFFAMSIILLLFLFLNPTMGYYFNIDEQFTVALLSLPFNEAWKLIVNDVHPPLYYLILMAFGQLLKLLHISVDALYLAKLLSLLPAVVLIILSYTKIKKEYGWLACGVFLFGITAMGNISEIFITGRMYSWSVLFMILAFMAYISVLKSSSVKSWILLTLFTILCIYTHYILVFPLFIMYLSYFIYIHINDEVDKKSEIKKTVASIIATIICYIPWIFTLIHQVSSINRTYAHTAKLSGDIIVNYMTCFVLQDTKQLLDMAIWKILAVVLLILLIIIFIREIGRFKKYEAFSIFSGINIYIFAILLSSFFVTFIFKGMTVRYFVAMIAVLWLSIAILLSKVKDNRILLVALILILALGVHGINTTVGDINYHNELGLEQKNVISDINKADNIVIYNNTYNTYHFLLNNTKEYSLKEYNGVKNPTYTYEDDLAVIMEDNPDKNVYLITVLTNITDSNEKYPDGITGKKLSRQGRNYILKLTQVNDDENSTESAAEDYTT
ncbi:MAG: hypothetical protein Q4Q22_04135 [Methanosphaera sp.]|nr:hypothetical protein [Methanosphaera sp.]